jgi:hypothetical protein
MAISKKAVDCTISLLSGGHQGAALGPMLLLIFVNDIQTDKTLSCFAMQHIQHKMSLLEQWFTKWRPWIDVYETIATLFT